MRAPGLLRRVRAGRPRCIWGGFALVGGEWGVEEEFDGLLVGHGGDGLEVGGVVDEALLDGADHESADGELLVDVVDDEALGGVAWLAAGLDIGWGGGLVEGDGAAGEEVGDHTPADVDGAEDVGLEADHAAGAGVDPDAALEAGEGFGLHVWGRPFGVGFEVEDDEGGV